MLRWLARAALSLAAALRGLTAALRGLTTALRRLTTALRGLTTALRRLLLGSPFTPAPTIARAPGPHQHEPQRCDIVAVITASM